MIERLAVSAPDLPKVLHELVRTDNLSEAVVLSTCNRVEVYAHAERFHDGCADVREVLSIQSGMPLEVVADELYIRHDHEAARHLFNVSAGLESVVVGEHEILGQVRFAWQVAQDETTTNSTLNTLFGSAIRAGKRVRTITALGRGSASLSSAAVALAGTHLNTLNGRKVLVLGTGKMGVGTLKSLADSDIAELFVANRTWCKAESTASVCGGIAVPLSGLGSVLTEVDLLIATTGASEIILEHSDINSVMADRDGTELLIVDLAVPRDVDPSAASLPGVTLLDMNHISDFMKQSIDTRSLEIDRAYDVVEEELECYQTQVSVRAVAPIVAALRARGDQICAYELNRHKSRLSELEPLQREAVESLVNSVVRKLLHEPTVQLKNASRSARGDRLAEALSDLFNL